MYVVTCYSYKGGVGRTMALVNVALELSNRGRRVLIVDFDLEAPGIETYKLPRSRKPVKGLVEYISDYLERDEAPDVADYLYPSIEAGEKSGGVWIMPAGLRDETYSSRLSDINWRTLYERKEGYLFFENLRAQWQDLLKPDYVLIDSRTGYTDIGGICTKQLPDAVIFLFLPDKQNLAGLTGIVRDIRNSTARRPKLLFVPSNIPESDDEHKILESRMAEFAKDLEYKELAGTIHHVNDNSFLDQVVVTVDRPNGRLAQKYRELTTAITRENTEDAEGVLNFLDRTLATASDSPVHISGLEVENRFSEILKLHPENPDVLHKLAKIRERQGRFDDALALYDSIVKQQLVKSEHVKPPTIKLENYLRHASLSLVFHNDKEAAMKDIHMVLDSKSASYFDVMYAIQIMPRVNGPVLYNELFSSNAFVALESNSKIAIALELIGEPIDGELIEHALWGMLSKNGHGEDIQLRIVGALGLALISNGKPDKALSLFQRESGGDIASMPIDWTFNYAMATWAVQGSPDRKALDRVIKESESSLQERKSPNFYQCASLAFFLQGDNERAIIFANAARQRLMAQDVKSFSCWRYSNVGPNEFLKDIDTMLEYFEGKGTKPPFLNDSTKSLRSAS